MHAWPDARVVSTALVRAHRRRIWRAALEGAAWGLAAAIAPLVAASAGLVSRPRAFASALVMVTAVTLLRGARVMIDLGRGGAAAATAAEIERRAAHCRNVLITAEELVRARPERVEGPPSYASRVAVRDAARLAVALDLRVLLPIRRPLAHVAAAAALWTTLAWSLPEGRLAGVIGTGVGAAELPSIRHVTVVVTPPAYAGQAVSTFRDVDHVEVLAGSRMQVEVAATAGAIVLETLTTKARMTRLASGMFAGDLLADADGFIALQADGSSGQPGARRLIGLVIRRDAPPSVRITAPARDLFLPDASRQLDIQIEARDDLGLDRVRLMYTKVSGSGETFDFTTGEWPVDVNRGDARMWTARSGPALVALGLARGDMVIYRASARDRRPGAPDVESDAFIVEIVGPGAEATGGFAIDDQKDKYALSQQMVILKTERLLARAPRVAKDALLEEALALAAEQRSVRAEFVFMMGGEFEDEEVEAAQEHELQEGREANRGRADLIAAIRAMSRASALLTDVDLAQALKVERVALAALQRAFTKSRYILRTLSERQRLDFARRLSGSLAGLAREPREMATPAQASSVAARRRALADLSTIAARDPLGAADAAAMTAVAESLLRSEPGVMPIQQIAASLTGAATAATSGNSAAARSALDRASVELTALIRLDLPDAPRDSAGLAGRRLQGALADALARRGGR